MQTSKQIIGFRILIKFKKKRKGALEKRRKRYEMSLLTLVKRYPLHE